MNDNVSVLPLRSSSGGAKLFLVGLVACMAALSSCKKETDVIGLDVQPPNDLIGADFQDTTTLVTRTVRADSLRTDESLIITGDAIIGTYMDPVFGKSSASLFTQLNLSALNPSFGTSPVVDSVVLSIAYNAAYYGKTQRVKQRVNVFEVLEDIKSENAYYSNNDTLALDPVDLANGYELTPRPTDSVYVMNKKVKPHMRVPLDNAWAQNLIETGTFSTKAGFQAAMKGIYITTQGTALSSEQGNMMYVKCGDESQSKVTIYYHNATADSLTYDFPLGSVARFSHFAHTYSPSITNDMLEAQLNGTSLAQNSTVFVQSMAGLRTKIEMPYLMNWLNAGKIAINKAELVIKVDNSDPTYMLDTFAAPAKLVIFGINDDGTSYVLPDANEGDNYMGGGYNATDKEYRFNIGRYLQQVLAGKKKNNGLYVLAANGAINANRVVLGGGTGPYRMKLNVSYTKLE
ncbi:MAG: DUF4270 domain-containing protein [Bacteroidia bacterium]